MNSVAMSYTESAGYVRVERVPAATECLSTTEEPTFLDRLRRGDEAAFDALVNRHHSALIRMAMGYVSTREVAEEVVQDTWMAVDRKFEPIRRPVFIENLDLRHSDSQGQRSGCAGEAPYDLLGVRNPRR